MLGSDFKAPSEESIFSPLLILKSPFSSLNAGSDTPSPSNEPSAFPSAAGKSCELRTGMPFLTLLASGYQDRSLAGRK